MKKKWTPELVIEKLQTIQKEKGCVPNFQQIRNSTIVSYCRKFFGGYRQACTAANINYDKVRLTKPSGFWTKERIYEEVEKLTQQYGDSLTAKFIKKINSPLYEAIGAYRGLSFKIILDDLGVMWKNPLKKWTKKKIISTIQSLYAVDPIYIKNRYVEKHEPMLLKAAQNTFGNWRHAVTQAGLNYDDILSLSFSLGELQIKDVLEQDNVPFILHARFQWLGQQHLDFYFPEIQKAVEYNGKQHYHPSFFGKRYNKNQAQQELQNIQERDNRKQKLCQENNIELLVVKYTVNDIGMLIHEFIGETR